ncbi:non-heme ferritin [bacterium]|nr:non-heme ferritin [bacterium]
MLSKTMVEKLNDQINIEFESSNLYLQMAAWCAWKGYEGGETFLRMHSEEERMHMMKLFSYVGETGALAKIGSTEQPKLEFESLSDMFEQILSHEKFVTSKINELVASAYEEKDFSTLNFLQWYVAEQHEEETLFNALLDKIKLIGHDGRGLYLIDKELGKQAARAAAAPAGE